MYVDALNNYLDTFLSLYLHTYLLLEHTPPKSSGSLL